MYKSHITVIVLIILLAGMSIGFNRYIHNSTGILLSYIHQVEESINEKDWGRAQSTFMNMENEWQPIKKWWGISLDHQEITDIETSLKRTGKYISNNNFDLILAELATLKVLVDNVASNEILSLENIL